MESYRSSMSLIFRFRSANEKASRTPSCTAKNSMMYLLKLVFATSWSHETSTIPQHSPRSDAVGLPVGDNVAGTVGESVGDAVGVTVGDTVGRAEGLSDGLNVG